MPVEKLSTGVDLYYESQGRGEAVVFIPGTGFAGNVWMETQVEAAVAIAPSYRARPERLRSVHSRQGCLYHRSDGQRRRRIAATFGCALGAYHRAFHGRPHRSLACPKFSRNS